MNTAVLQGSIMATSHGITRLNRHRFGRGFHITAHDRIGYQIRKRNNHDEPATTEEEPPLLQNCSHPAEIGTTVRGISVDSAKSKEFLRLNVGGHRFMLRKETILSRKVVWLLDMNNTHERLSLADAYFSSTNEYYFERPPSLFHIVYQFYLTGQIHQPLHLCPIDILDELDYWGIIPDNYLAPCCSAEDKNDLDSISSSSSEEPGSQFKHLSFGELRRKVWNVIEEPTSSGYAQVFATFSVLFVLISISGLVLGSLPELQVSVQKNTTEGVVSDMEPHPVLGYIEYVCIVWFILEYAIKMLVTADRRRTFFQLLNIIDLLAILPFIIEMLLFLFGVSTEQLRDLKGAFLVIRILRVLRVIRVLKLGRYSSGLQMFGKTLKASFRQLGMMAMKKMNLARSSTRFQQLVGGYGDLTPVTVAGKLVATGAIACGVLVLALPITIIVDNFMKVAEGERGQAQGVNRRFGHRTVMDPVPASPMNNLTRNSSMKKPNTEDTIC
ncbi:Potassium voltage-gated channel subfamily F member 1 [Trichostrongylus colubriformis]|uniref:Potassium voltage-gated channel subfamily F member 1 n=1 Tax=Trichostrongylus colubriformis TaxID=6319 RepID=A0AAN8FGM5_TRICO